MIITLYWKEKDGSIATMMPSLRHIPREDEVLLVEDMEEALIVKEVKHHLTKDRVVAGLFVSSECREISIICEKLEKALP